MERYARNAGDTHRKELSGKGTGRIPCWPRFAGVSSPPSSTMALTLSRGARPRTEPCERDAADEETSQQTPGGRTVRLRPRTEGSSAPCVQNLGCTSGGTAAAYRPCGVSGGAVRSPSAGWRIEARTQYINEAGIETAGLAGGDRLGRLSELGTFPWIAPPGLLERWNLGNSAVQEHPPASSHSAASTVLAGLTC